MATLTPATFPPQGEVIVEMVPFDYLFGRVASREHALKSVGLQSAERGGAHEVLSAGRLDASAPTRRTSIPRRNYFGSSRSRATDVRRPVGP